MWELLIASTVVGLLLAAGVLHRFVPWVELLRGGAWLVVGGTVLSIAAGVVYHVALYRALAPRAALTKRWWLDPTSLHPHLTPSERPRVMPWFVLGAFGFCVVMFGCLVVLLAVWRAE